MPADLLATVAPEVDRLSAEIAAHLADGARGERLREGLTIAVVGPPNAGKSSLVNRLAQRDVAIVAAQPGTTRDVLEVHLDLAATRSRCSIPPGCARRPTAVEAEGVRRARARAAAADLRLLLLDGALWPALDAATLALFDEDALCVVNKADLGRVPESPEVGRRRGAARSPAGPARASTGCSRRWARWRPSGWRPGRRRC